LTSENSCTVADLCNRLDGLPLAIELAAAHMGVLSADMVLGRLANRLSFLHWDARDLPERQQTLRATISWSYDLLAEVERSLFRSLGVFPGGLTLEAAEAVWNGSERGHEDVFETISSLVTKSLVVCEGDGKSGRRFRLLDSVREYALDQLKSHGEAEAASEAHARYFLDLAEAADPYLDGHVEHHCLARERENLFSALDCLRTRTDLSDLLLRLAAALGRLWPAQLASEGRRWLVEALSRATAAPPELRVKGLTQLGAVLIRLDETQEAQSALAEALRLARSSRDSSAVIRALIYLGRLAAAKEDLEEARQFLNEAEKAARAAGDSFLIAKALLFLASVDLLQGEPERAEGLLDETLVLHRSRGDDFSAAVSLAWLALAIGNRKSRAGACAVLDECLDICRDIEEPYPFLVAGVAAIVLAGESGDPEQKAQLLGSLDLLSQPGSLMPLVAFKKLHECRADLSLRLGRQRYEAALDGGKWMSLDQSIALARQVLHDLPIPLLAQAK
jgi:tetratricopeptide (TPR) repeat protein